MISYPVYLHMATLHCSLITCSAERKFSVSFVVHWSKTQGFPKHRFHLHRDLSLFSSHCLCFLPLAYSRGRIRSVDQHRHKPSSSLHTSSHPISCVGTPEGRGPWAEPEGPSAPDFLFSWRSEGSCCRCPQTERVLMTSCRRARVSVGK